MLASAAAALVVLGSYQSRSAQAQTTSAVVVGAGDIASCTSTGDSATAKLLANTPGTVLAIGDNAYMNGSAAEFKNCYGPTWGQFKARTQPVVGNHEYRTSGASGYFNYFGAAAGPVGKGYYSYDRGAWHIIALNSECDYWITGYKGDGQCSSQKQADMIAWLKADLAANPTACTLAYFHQPRFSSGQGGNATETQGIWNALYEANADVVLSGHDHVYERFAPQTPSGQLDTVRGIREFVVGSGGVNHGRFNTIKPNSQVRNATAFGVLRLTLNSTSYSWKFLPQAGKTFTDSGTTACH
jgi:hypothetical protein